MKSPYAPLASQLLAKLGVGDESSSGSGTLAVRSPIDGGVMYDVAVTTDAQLQHRIARAAARFQHWRDIPAPQRGSVVRELGVLCRQHKETLAQLITLETGKILSEGRGEVQEVIDICEFAVGLSRQLHGLTMASERASHKLLETWHPMGVCAVITAFNFPAAVWAWNAALALVCGNTVVWKPSEKTPMCALAMDALLRQAARNSGVDPEGLNEVIVGMAWAGQQVVASSHVKLVSATGSTRMGLAVAQACAGLFKRSILELGGNNAAILAPSADVHMAIHAIAFAAAGTAGQRCTTLRRLFVHETLYGQAVDRLVRVFATLPVGNPLADGTLVGPLIDRDAGDAMRRALEEAARHGAKVHHGERLATDIGEEGIYVRPAIVEMPRQSGPMLQETFAPILYVTRYSTLDEAIAMNNATAHGLSSSIFTNDLREAERFTSSAGSDCGIANVNIGTSGAEIGGAFGGEKETGGGRESGSDAWKGYMRRATNTINYGSVPALAQGVRFDA